MGPDQRALQHVIGLLPSGHRPVAAQLSAGHGAQLGGKCGSSAASGLIDSAGYLGAVLSGTGIEALAQRSGWSAAFGGLAGTAALTVVAAAAYWTVERSARRNDESAARRAESPRGRPS